MDFFHIAAGPTTYLILGEEVPRRDQLPWGDEECDGFIAILDPKRVTEPLAERVYLGLLALQIDWIEAMGEGSELLHDRIDRKSVAIGRQSRVGDGRPMTAWHEDFCDIEAMADYVKLGGQGASENKLVLVVGPEHSASLFADRLRDALSKSFLGYPGNGVPNGPRGTQ